MAFRNKRYARASSRTLRAELEQSVSRLAMKIVQTNDIEMAKLYPAALPGRNRAAGGSGAGARTRRDGGPDHRHNARRGGAKPSASSRKRLKEST